MFVPPLGQTCRENNKVCGTNEELVIKLSVSIRANRLILNDSQMTSRSGCQLRRAANWTSVLAMAMRITSTTIP